MSETTAVGGVSVPPKDELSEEQFFNLLTKGDLSGLGLSLRAKFLFRLAEKMGLDPWRRPFDLLTTKDNRVIVYANKSCAQQIRENLKIEYTIDYMGAMRLFETVALVANEDGKAVPQRIWNCDPEIYQVIITAIDKDGRKETEMGTAQLAGLDPREKKDAPLKAMTRAKRRATLNLGKVSLPDENELDYARTPPQRMTGPAMTRTVVQQPSADPGEVIYVPTDKFISAEPTLSGGAAAEQENAWARRPGLPRAGSSGGPAPSASSLPRANAAPREEASAVPVNPRGIVLPPPVAPTKPPV